MSLLTVSRNEITDLIRASAKNWLTTQQGGSVDEFAYPDSSYGIWEAGTNLFTRGQCDSLGASAWVKDGASVTLTVDGATPAPLSPQTIKVVTTASSQGVNANTGAGLGAAAGVVAVGSIWFKGTQGTTYRVRVAWINTDTTFTTGSFIDVVATGNWQYVAPGSIAVASGKTGDSIQLRIDTTSSAADTFWVAHAMIQTGVNVVSPYVATSGGSTATRAAARVQAPASLLNAAHGWVALRMRMGWASSAMGSGTGPRAFSWATDSNNWLSGYYSGDAQAWRMGRNVAGVADQASVADAFNARDLRTVIFAWTATQVMLSVAGSAFTTLAITQGAMVPSGVLFDIGRSADSAANWLDSDVLWASCGTGSLSDADAAVIAGWGNKPQPKRGWPVASLPTMVWPAYNEFYSDTGDHRPSDHDDSRALYSKARMMGYSHQEAYYLANRSNP